MSSCPEELRGRGMDQARPTGTSTAEGAGSRRGPGVQRVWLAAGTFCSNGDVERATSSLLSRGPLGMRRWAGRASRHSLLRPSRASHGRGQLGRVRVRRVLHTHPAAKAVKPVQSLRDEWRASVLMKLSPAVRRCREKPPEAAQRRLPWPAVVLRPPRGEPRTVRCPHDPLRPPWNDQGPL